MNDQGSSDRLTIVFAAVSATMMIGNQLAGKTVRDALFLSYFDITDLSKIMIACAVFSAVAVVSFSRLLTKYGPARLVPPLYLASGLIFAAQWIAMAAAPNVVTLVLYMHISVLNSLLISGLGCRSISISSISRMVGQMSSCWTNASHTAPRSMPGPAMINGIL